MSLHHLKRKNPFPKNHRQNNYGDNYIQSIHWQYQKGTTISTLTPSNINKNTGQISYSHSFSSAEGLYERKNCIFTCVVVDKYGNYITSDSITISFQEEISRIKDIFSNLSIETGDDHSYTWTWPVGTAGPSGITVNTTTTIGKFSYEETITNGQTDKKITCAGTPKTSTEGSTMTNAAAAVKDGYPYSNFGKYYTGYNAPWILFMVIPSSIATQYEYINLTLTTSLEATDKFSCKIYAKQGDTNIIDEQDLIGKKTITLNNFTAGSPINLYTKIYYNTTWPNIGYVLNGTGTMIYNANNMPKIDGTTVALTSAIAKKRTQTSLRMKSIRSILNNNILRATNSYSPPQITQLCPISINCATGEYTMQVKYNTINWPNGILESENNNNSIEDPKLICYLSSLRNGQSFNAQQSVGDMILSNNLIFSEQNHFDYTTNTLKPWSEQDKTLCHRITYDGDVPLEHFIIKYKNLYL